MKCKESLNESPFYFSNVLRSAYFLPVIFLIIIFYFFYKQDLLPQAIISGDLGVPYPYPPLVNLSTAAPWYNVFSSFLYAHFYDIYGYVVNYLQVFLYIPAYITMYWLLRELDVRKFPAVLLSMFYLMNPIVFFFVFTYNNLMWSEYYLFAPLFLFLIARFRKSGDFSCLFILVILISFYLEIQTAPLFYNIRLLLPVLGLPLFYVTIKRILSEKRKKRTALYYILSVVLFVVLNFEPLLTVAGIASKTSSLAATSGSAFQSLHYGNVVYTYQSQNLFYAISGLVVYPNYQNSFLMGSGQIYLPITGIFVTLVVIAVILSFFRRGGNSGLRITLSLSALGIWTFISLTQAGYTLPLFVKFPLLYLWEYPSYLESALMVIYIPLLAGLFPNNNVDETWTKRLRSISSRLKHSVRMKQIRKKIEFLAPFIVAVLLFSYIAPMAATNTGGFAPIPSYETQNPLYHDLYNFFKNKNGDYKVLIVPFNQTIYKELGAAVPDSNILALPYAYQNNPSAFANSTNFYDLYSDISLSHFSNFSLLLNDTGIKYIIVLKTGKEISIVKNLSNLSYLSLGINTNSYSILEYKEYQGIAVESNPYILDSLGKDANFTSNYELNKNYNFTNISGYSKSNPFIPYWEEWSNNLPYYHAFVYRQKDASINVYGNKSENYRQLSEIYARVNVPGSSTLKLTADVHFQNNTQSYLFVIAHSNSTTNAFFSKNQYFMKIPFNDTGNVTLTVTVPGSTDFVYFGVMVYNITEGNGSFNLSSLRLVMTNTFYQSEYVKLIQGELPFNSIEQPSSNISGYAYRSVLALYPGDGFLNISHGNWISSTVSGFETTQSNMSLKINKKESLYLSIEPFPGTSIFINGVTLNSAFQGAISGSSVNGTVNLSTSGNAVFRYVALVSDINSHMQKNISISNNGEKFIISNHGDTAQIVLVGSPLPSSFHSSFNVSLLSVQKVNGLSEYLYVILPGNNICYEFNVSATNVTMVLFNLTTLPVIFVPSFYVYLWYRKRKKQ